MKKISLILILAFFLLVFTLSFTVAEGCCENLKNGAWCQTTTQEDCSSTIVPTSCSSFSPCALGTCIDEDKGSCVPNTPKRLCEDEGGLWNSDDKASIQRCQNGCCLFGEYASFVTQIECKQLASVYGVDVNFRSDVTQEFSCYALASPDVKGACILVENQTGRDCKLTTRESCLSAGGEFHEDYLCTAPELATDCAKSSKTICKDDKIYFLDTCENLANVYDETMFSKNPNEWTPLMEDYWTTIQEPLCIATPDSADCGDCSYIAGSVCKEYKSGKKTMPAKPKYGDNVCSNLNCYYDTDEDGTDEVYKHGESWCAYSEGVYHGINVSNQTSEFLIKSFGAENSDYSKYNLPGSRYYRLMCVDGEVIVEPCRDFRNEVCLQSNMGAEADNFKIAQCYINTWRDCFNNTNQEDCEESLFCKWVEGYRLDGQIVTAGADRNQEEQGTCVPTFSPGFNFWEPGNDGEAICSLGNVQEIASFETNVIWTKRETFEDTPLCEISKKGDDAVQRCFAGCYAIPGYGLEAPVSGGYKGIDSGKYLDLDALLNVHAGENNALPKKFESYCISDRKGYYCPGKTGEVGGNDVKCADTAGITPIFLTHQEWVLSIKNRAKSLGDCGYKPGAYVPISKISKELEGMTVLFQILKQDQSLKKNTSIEKIYDGNFNYIPGGESGNYRK